MAAEHPVTSMQFTVRSFEGIGILMVDTSPVKGEVFVDEVSLGIAPVMVEVAMGQHAVSFGKVNGYDAPLPQTVDVAEGGTKEVAGIYTLVPGPKPPGWLPYILLGGGIAVLVASLAASGKKKSEDQPASKVPA